MKVNPAGAVAHTPGVDSSGSRIVVGADGSESSLQAVDWASHEARLRNAHLVIVHISAWRREALRVPVFEEQARIEQQILEDARARALRAEPEVFVTTVLEEPPADQALIRASDNAELLVVGSRGLGGFDALLVGSVSHKAVLHARCPVVVIRPAATHSAGQCL